MSYLLSDIEKSEVMKDESLLFSGDIILGAPSTKVMEMKSYMQSLYRLRKEEFSHICLPHSIEIKPEFIIVERKKKLEEYIKYRSAFASPDRLKQPRECRAIQVDSLSRQVVSKKEENDDCF